MSTALTNDHFLQVHDMFILSEASRLAVELTQPPIPLVLGALSQEIYWPGRKAYYFPPSSPEVKNEWT